MINSLDMRQLRNILIFIIAIGFLLKMGAGWLLSDSFFTRGNSYTPLNALAFNLLQSGEYAIQPGIPSIDYEPLFPAMLAFSYGLFGKSWLGVTLFNAMLYGATSWILYLIGKKIWSPVAGIFAGAYHSFYPFLFLQSLSVIDTTLFVFLVFLLVYCVLFVSEGSLWVFGSVGALVALLFLARGSAIAFMPPIALFYLYQLYFKNEKARLLKLLLSALAALIIISPWVIRNYQHTGKIVLSTHGSFGIWQGNNPRALKLLKADKSLDHVYRDNPKPEIYANYPMKPRPPIEAVEVAGKYRQQAILFITNNPQEFIELAVWKFIKFWSVFYNPVSSKYAYGSTNLRQIVNFIAFVPLLALFPIGLWSMWMKTRQRDIAVLLLGMISFYTAAHMIALGYTRVRLPIDPLLMLFAGVALTTIFPKLSNLTISEAK